MISITDYLGVLVGLTKVKCFSWLNTIPAPRVIAYTVTWRCNAACDMCGIRNVDRSLKDKKQELDANDIQRIFKDPLLKKLDLIRFTGGEPFLKEDFLDIVEEMIRNTQTKIYYITTNGFYSQKIFDFVERLAPKTKNLVIQVSLDALGEAHDNIRKLNGLYEKIINTLTGLKILRNKYKFTYGINQTLTCQTANYINYIDEISALCQKFGCDHKIYIAQETHESDILEGRKLSPEPILMSNPRKEDIRSLYDTIEQHYKKDDKKKGVVFSPEDLWRITEKYIIFGSRNRIMHGSAFPNPKCLAMFFYLRLLPNGVIMPCTLKPTPIGNLKNQTFMEIWRSKKAREMRREVKSCKGCWVECDIVPNFIYSFNIIKEICKERLLG